MGISAEELADLEEELRNVLIDKGWAVRDADEIIDTASSAAHQGIASMVAVAGAAQEHNRDSAIILALYIMERLALSGDSQLDPRNLAARQEDGGEKPEDQSPEAGSVKLRAC
jgi:hypothetical protein